MSLKSMTIEQLESRLSIMEDVINRERDTKSLPHHNQTYQMIFDELVRRDMEKENDTLSMRLRE